MELNARGLVLVAAAGSTQLLEAECMIYTEKAVPEDIIDVIRYTESFEDERINMPAHIIDMPIFAQAVFRNHETDRYRNNLRPLR